MSDIEIKQVELEINEEPVLTQQVIIIRKLNKLQLDRKNWSPPEIWHSDLDPAGIKDDMNRIFVELDRPIAGLKLGILYAKYEIAKKLWINCPITLSVLSGVYMVSMCILTTYAMWCVYNYDILEDWNKALLAVLYIYDIITRICVLFGIFNYHFAESRSAIPMVFGGLLWVFKRDRNGILLYFMSFILIFAEVSKRLYYRFLENLLE